MRERRRRSQLRRSRRSKGREATHAHVQTQDRCAVVGEKVESDIGHGVYVPTTADRRRPRSDLIDNYKAEYLPSATIAPMRETSRRSSSDGRMPRGISRLTNLPPQAIAGFRFELLDRRTRADKPVRQSTVNRYLAARSAVCQWAWKELGWLSANPVLSVTKGAEHTGIVRYLSEDERKALLKACEKSKDRTFTAP